MTPCDFCEARPATRGLLCAACHARPGVRVLYRPNNGPRRPPGWDAHLSRLAALARLGLPLFGGGQGRKAA